jgi:hypothetical protein
MPIQKTEVKDSSIIKALEYNTEDKSLIVTFHQGRQYRYIGIPSGIYRGLITAESIGNFFHKEIKDIYACKEIGDGLPDKKRGSS